MAGATQDVRVVAEDGRDLNLTVQCLHVATDGVHRGHVAPFDPGDPALGDPHPLGDIGLGQGEGLASLSEPVPVDAGLVALACLGNALLPPAVSISPARMSLHFW